MTKLSEEQVRALAERPGEPLWLEHPTTQEKYVIVQKSLFERLQQAIDYDDDAIDPREYYPAFAKAVETDIDAPGMEEYDDYDAHRGRQ